jgi:protocatechuate 4,5-dioxygenase alpha chain
VKGYWLNQAFNDLRHPEAREAFTADLNSYLDRYPLSQQEKDLVLHGDWGGCIGAGASVYTLTKVGATTGISLLAMGAAMRGMTPPEFSAFLKEQNEAAAPYAVFPSGEEVRRG